MLAFSHYLGLRSCRIAHRRTRIYLVSNNTAVCLTTSRTCQASLRTSCPQQVPRAQSPHLRGVCRNERIKASTNTLDKIGLSYVDEIEVAMNGINATLLPYLNVREGFLQPAGGALCDLAFADPSSQRLPATIFAVGFIRFSSKAAGWASLESWSRANRNKDDHALARPTTRGTKSRVCAANCSVRPFPIASTLPRSMAARSVLRGPLARQDSGVLVTRKNGRYASAQSDGPSREPLRIQASLWAS